MRQANALCDDAIRAGIAAAQPGVLDAVVSGAAYNAMISGGGDLPVRRSTRRPGTSSTLPASSWTARPVAQLRLALQVSWLVNSGGAATYGRSITGSRTLEPQDQIVMEICGVYHRYCAVNERTVILGTPSSLQKKMYSVVVGAIDAMMELAKPGVRRRRRASTHV